MSKLITCLVALILTVGVGPAAANSTSTPLSPSSTKNPAAVASSIEDRLADLELALTTPASDAHLQRKLRDYLGTGSHSTERMLGRANQYFPIFEQYLARHGMPESLKYLAVAESMLVPGAVSSARAAGLWQLMPATAREMGLRVDGTVDERLDLHRSTEAAVVMLKGLYQKFGDWHLALAAYNCGPGRVRRAIRASGGHTFYPKVKPFLPRESQKYVAAYVAAAYTLNYYGDYGLTPADHLATDSIGRINVFRTLNLRRLANACELSYAQLRRMNPSYVRGYIPRNSHGYRLRVPLRDKWAVQTYVWGRPNLVQTDPDPVVELAGVFAGDFGFDARFWMFGCRGNNLRHTPSVAERNAVAALNVDVFYNYQAVAMN